MSISAGESDNESSSTGNFSQSVWDPQSQRLADLYRSAVDTYGTSSRGMQGVQDQSTRRMQNTYKNMNPNWKNQMQGGAYKGMDLQGMYGDALQGGGNEQFIDQSIMGGQGNNYVDAMKQQMTTDSQNNLSASLASNDMRANAAGMSGGSRHGMTERGLYDDANDRLAREQTNLGFNSFDRDLDRKLGIAQRADRFDMNKLGNVSGMLNQKQDTMNQGLMGGSNMQNINMGAFAPSMAPWQGMGAFSNIIGKPTVLSEGTMTGGSDAGGWGGSFGFA